MRDFKDKVAVVTGAASGIGAGLAERFALEGAQVVLVDRDSPEKVVDRITASGGRAVGAQADVSSREAMDGLAKRVFDEFGRVDVLCNNAGVVLFSSLQDTSDADWDWILKVNIK